jgi:N-acetylneuraminate synthase
MQRAQELGMICFSSPFDESAIDFLESLNVPAYKIASFECIDLPLIRKAASTGKPLIISTGMASILEIAEAVDAARSNGCQQLALLKCTSTYPASPENSNLKTIAHLRDLFGCEVGLSDHTMGIGAAIISVAFGATIIEKHFTLARADGGVDSTFSMEPEELADLVVESHRAWQALGNIQYGPTESEKKAVLRRRSIYISKDIKAGDLLTLDNLRRVRPGYGLAPKYYEMALGRRVKKDLKAGTPLSWEILD